MRETVSSWKKQADKWFSIYVRQKEKWCFTCGKRGEWKDAQAGHYIPRSHNALRYNERNTHRQCRACNIFRYGAMDVYALALQRKYGPKILEELAAEKKKVKQFSVEELKAIVERYKKLAE